MNRRTRLATFAAMAAFCAGGCTVERFVHLYPANDVATETGVLTGHIVGRRGHGTIDASLPDGEYLQGEYTYVPSGSMNFGHVFGMVYGRGGFTSVSGTSTGFTMSGTAEGQADLFGNRGTSAHCEFLNSNMTGHGYGACLSSKGALYRFEY